jgi:hypothetical protein
MYGRTVLLSALFATSGLLACGGGKEKVKDPTDTPAPTTEETPKWDSSSTTTDPSTTPSTKSSTGAGPVNEGQKRRADQYDKEGTEVVLKRAARQVKDNCGQAKDENGKAVGPWGKATIQVALGHNGHSKGATVPAPYQGKPTGSCVEKAFSNLQFPPWAGADTQVDWEVEIIEPGKESKK